MSPKRSGFCADSEGRTANMAKGKAASAFFCQSCGYESAKWMGQCPACREWNSFVEERVVTGGSGRSTNGRSAQAGRMTGTVQTAHPMPLSEISMQQSERVLTHIGELDRVLGGGIVSGSLVLVGGDPVSGSPRFFAGLQRAGGAVVKRSVYIRRGISAADQIARNADRRVCRRVKAFM